MRLFNGSIFALFVSLALIKSSLASPMNREPNPDPNHYWTGMSQPTGYESWNSGTPAIAEYHRIGAGSSSSYYRGPQHNMGGYSGHPSEQMSTQWSNYPHQYDMAGGSVSGSSGYDLDAHFSTGMEMGGSAPEEEDRQKPITFSNHETPTKKELSERYQKYNTYPWQRALPQAVLEHIYQQIGVYWTPMATRTFIKSWDAVNTALYNDAALAKRIVQDNDVAAIKDVAQYVLPKKVHNGTPRLPLTMETFLEAHRHKRVRTSVRDAIVVEPTVDENGVTVPSWSPITWDPEKRKMFIKLLGRYWKLSSSAVEARLASYGRACVSHYGPLVMDSNSTVSKRAATEMSHRDAIGKQEVRALNRGITIREGAGWAPLSLSEEQQKELLRRLVFYWGGKEADIVSHLYVCGWHAIERFALTILGKSRKDAQQASKELFKAGTEGGASAGYHDNEHQERQKGKHRNWAPANLDDVQKKELVRRLVLIWREKKAIVVAQLEELGPEIIAGYSVDILSDNNETIVTASKGLAQHFMPHRETTGSQTDATHHTQQEQYSQQYYQAGTSTAQDSYEQIMQAHLQRQNTQAQDGQSSYWNSSILNPDR